MILYLYKVGTQEVICEIDAQRVGADAVLGTDGYVRAVLEGYDYSSKEDLSEALCAQERAKKPNVEQKVAQIEDILADMLFGGAVSE